MRTWRLVAVGAALFALVGLPAVWTSAWASDADKVLEKQVEATEEADLEARVEELETQVAELQTAVAELQEAGATDETDLAEEATPTPIAATAGTTCGRPYASWGAGTSDGINVQLVQMVSGDEADFAVEGADIYVIEVALVSGRDEDLVVEPEDYVLVDCDGVSYTPLEEGVEPSVAQGTLGPGESVQGWVTFAVAPGAQPAAWTYGIQSPGRSGGEVSCPLVDRDSAPGSLDDAAGGAGCSARGGSG